MLLQPVTRLPRPSACMQVTRHPIIMVMSWHACHWSSVGMRSMCLKHVQTAGVLRSLWATAILLKTSCSNTRQLGCLSPEDSGCSTPEGCGTVFISAALWLHCSCLMASLQLPDGLHQAGGQLRHALHDGSLVSLLQAGPELGSELVRVPPQLLGTQPLLLRLQPLPAPRTSVR